MTSFHSGTMMQAEYFHHCVTIWQISQLGSCQRGNLENAQVSPISRGEGTSLLELVHTMLLQRVSCWSTLANMVVRVGLQGDINPSDRRALDRYSRHYMLVKVALVLCRIDSSSNVKSCGIRVVPFGPQFIGEPDVLEQD